MRRPHLISWTNRTQSKMQADARYPSYVEKCDCWTKHRVTIVPSPRWHPCLCSGDHVQCQDQIIAHTLTCPSPALCPPRLAAGALLTIYLPTHCYRWLRNWRRNGQAHNNYHLVIVAHDPGVCRGSCGKCLWKFAPSSGQWRQRTSSRPHKSGDLCFDSSL